MPTSVKSRGKENKTDATTWSNQEVKVSLSTGSKSTLIIERRPEECLDENVSKPHTITKGLKELKVFERPSMQFWMIGEVEEESSNQRCMYRKSDVYLGVKECSFEEMKALKWLRECSRQQVIEQATAVATTPKQKPFSQYSALKNAAYPPDLDDFVTPPRPVRSFSDDHDDLVVGFLPDTPLNERDRKLSSIKEEERTPKEKLKFKIYRDDSN